MPSILWREDMEEKKEEAWFFDNDPTQDVELPRERRQKRESGLANRRIEFPELIFQIENVTHGASRQFEGTLD
jgi:hypothetical protein